MKNVKNDDVICIKVKKETLANIVFSGLLVAAGLFLLWGTVMGVRGMLNAQKGDIDLDKVTYFTDDNLKVTYPVPAGTWVFSEMDTSSAKEVVTESQGDDKTFNIFTDKLKDELVSSLLLNKAGVEGYRQFMSFSFKPKGEYAESAFVTYSKELFKRDLEASGSYKKLEITDSFLNSDKCAVIKAVLTEEVTTKDKAGKENKTDADLYYTQYTKEIGENTVSITFGSVNEDITVDDYLKYFISNIKNLSIALVN